MTTTHKKPNIGIAIATFSAPQFNFHGGAAEYEAFKNHRTISMEQDGEELLIPYHAVERVVVQVTATDETKADPYCK